MVWGMQSPGTSAQEGVDGTPTAATVTFDPVAGGAVPPLVTSKAGVRLEWARFTPGAHYAVSPDNPSLLLVAIESGTLTVRSSAPLVVNRHEALSTPGAGTQEEVPAGTETLLAAGDSFVRPPLSEQVLWNDSREPAVALTAFIGLGSAQEAPGAMTTPTPDRNSTGLVVALAVVVAPECPAGYTPAELQPVATPGGGGGGGGGGGVAVAIAAAPECAGAPAGSAAATPMP